MRSFIAFIRKEFYHILRDARSLMLLILMPIALMIIFGFAVTNEVKNNSVAVYDYSNDIDSHSLTVVLNASQYFDVTDEYKNETDFMDMFRKNKASIILVIPHDFGSNMHNGKGTSIQILADASDPNLATTLTSYISSIINNYVASRANGGMPKAPVNTEVRMLYNPELKSAFTFVPGVMGLILMLISAMMTSVSIVREKEFGTMEVLLVSPLRPFTIVIAKAIPYLMIGILNVATILLLSVFLLDLPVRGNILLLFAECTLFIIACLSLGLLISTLAGSQQVAMLISLVGLMLPTMLLSGFIFPIENMPTVLRIISAMVPARWFILIIKAIMLKGLGLSSVWKENIILISMTIFFISVSVKRFKVRLA
jgi:ABC-2 type transport system permease protein